MAFASQSARNSSSNALLVTVVPAWCSLSASCSGLRSAVAGVGSRDGSEGRVVGQLLELGAVERFFERPPLQRRGEIEERPCRRRDRNAVMNRQLVGADVAGAMNPKTTPGA